MPILDLYTRDNQKALEAQAELGRREIPKEVGIFDGVLSATGKGLGAAALETGRALTYAAGITPSGAIYKGLRDGEAPSLDKWFDESEYGKKLGETVKGLQPDPQTTGKAASIMFEVARMGGKAVGHVMTAGPAAPLTFGLDEGATETFKLTDQGRCRDGDCRWRGAWCCIRGGHGAACGRQDAEGDRWPGRRWWTRVIHGRAGCDLGDPRIG